MNVSLHSGFIRHPKIAGLSDAAFRLWLAMLAYAAEQLTDGIISKRAALPALSARSTPRLLAELTEIPMGYSAGLLEDKGDHYLIHGWLDWNDSRAEVQAGRARLRERVRRHRDKRNGVTDPVTHSVTHTVCTEGNSDLRPPTNEQEHTPQPPSRGEGGGRGSRRGQITRKERKQAEETRRRAFGRCPHQPPCADYDTCVTTFVMEQRERRGAAAEAASCAN